MMEELKKQIGTDAGKAMEALPVVTGAIAQMQASLTDQQHAAVITAAADALTIAAQSVKTLGAKGVIGNKDATDIAEGADIAADVLSIVHEIVVLVPKLKSLVKFL